MEDLMTKKRQVLFLMVAFSFLFTLSTTPLLQAEEYVLCAGGCAKLKKSEAKFSAEHEGKTYYFCSEECKAAFEKDPEKFIEQHKEHAHQKAHKCKANCTCPKCTATSTCVCGMKMKKSEAKFSAEYKGKTYYFCCEKCKEKFEKDPEKCIEQMQHKCEGETTSDVKSEVTKDPEKYIKES